MSEMENIKGSAEDEGSHHRFPFLLQFCHFCASSIFNPFQSRSFDEVQTSQGICLYTITTYSKVVLK